jgi:anti-sigma regulatory factor (Ser/Thr protein kinase)
MSEHSLRLPPDPTSSRTARRFVGDTLSSAAADPDIADIAVLLTSELATNAILHARSDLTITVRLHSQVIRVEVADENPRLPSASFVSVDALSGRGLNLVQAAASNWGIENHEAGKSVWFELDSSPDGPATR